MSATKAVTITLTPEQIDALGYVLDLAHGDQESYLMIGNPRTDYGDEWPSTAAWKAGEFRHVADFAGRLGLHGETERWNAIAESYEASGKEYHDNDPISA